jgi:hypothetical protein
MSIKSRYSEKIQTAWATVFAFAWVCSLTDKRTFDEYKKGEDKTSWHFHHDLVLDPRATLESASRGEYPCEEFNNPTLPEAAKTIINSGLVLPFPDAPQIASLNAEQLRQFFDQDGVMGVLRFT